MIYSLSRLRRWHQKWRQPQYEDSLNMKTTANWKKNWFRRPYLARAYTTLVVLVLYTNYRLKEKYQYNHPLILLELIKLQKYYFPAFCVYSNRLISFKLVKWIIFTSCQRTWNNFLFLITAIYKSLISGIHSFSKVGCPIKVC